MLTVPYSILSSHIHVYPSANDRKQWQMLSVAVHVLHFFFFFNRAMACISSPNEIHTAGKTYFAVWNVDTEQQ